MELKNMIMQVS
jgi:hypothetical protein